MRERVKRYATVGSLSRHFRRHVSQEMGKQLTAEFCDIRGMHRMHLPSHGERCHDTVTMYRQTLQLMEIVLGKEHPNTLMSMNNLAISLRQQGKFIEYLQHKQSIKQ
jgi:hypothetical protein